MRELEVLRVEDDGQYVVCIDRETDEHFRIRANDDLRAAARGDTTELGQLPVAGDAALRPREIQARIRAGASVAELAEIAGVSPSKIERYAHPVLLERARAAELARASHPLTVDGPSLATLGELVAECLVLRGDVPADARWDSWKADTGQWMIQLAFREGRTENFAHWRFRPGTHGGTTDPVDELGVELTDPELARSSRRSRLAAVPTPVPPPASRPEMRPNGHTEVTVNAATLIDAQQAASNQSASTQARPPQRPAQPAPQQPAPQQPVQAPVQHTDPPTAPESPAQTELELPTEPAPEPEAPAVESPAAEAPAVEAPEPEAPAPTAPAPGPTAVPSPRDLADRKRPGAPRESGPRESGPRESGAAKTEPAAESDQRTTASKHRAKRGKPAVPAWEDVLLGVRAHPED